MSYRSWPVLAFGFCVGILALVSQDLPLPWRGAVWGLFIGLFAAPVGRWSSAPEGGEGQ